MNAKDLCRYFGRLETERRFYEPIWQDIADEELGKRDFISPETALHSPGRERHSTIYDTTALFSGNMLAAALHQWLTNTATTWFGIGPEDERLLDVDRVALWFSDLQRRMYSVFNRPEAGFTPAMNEYWNELVFFGTSGLFVEDVPGLPVRFRAVPLQQLYVAEGPDGKIDTVIRKFPLTNRQAVAKFAGNDLERAKIVVPGAAEGAQKDPEQPRMYLHYVHPTDDAAYRTRTSAPSRYPFESLYVDQEREHEINRGGFAEQPYLVGRWDKEAGETYGGNYPGRVGLPEAKMLNEMGKDFITAVQKKIFPPIQVSDDGVILPLKTQPRGVNVVRASTFAKEPIKPLPIDGDVGLALGYFQERQKALRAAFLHDLLQILQTPFQTATQVIEITEKAQAFASPTVGRQQVETLEPMIERTFAIMRRAKMLPPAPPELLGTTLKIEYISPVQRSQRLSESRSIEEFLQVVAGLAVPLDAQSVDTIDLDAVVRRLAKGRSIPPELLRGVRQVAKIREAQMQLAQEAQQRQDVALAADVAQKAGPMMEGFAQ